MDFAPALIKGLGDPAPWKGAVVEIRISDLSEFYASRSTLHASRLITMFPIPKEIISIVESLKKANFQAFLVGGCVRDFLRGVKPKDWDIATDARPDQIQKIFPESFYKNKFLTVTVQIPKLKTENEQKLEIKEVEITTFRTEEKYTDKRHPDKVKPAKTIEEDLSRRDFTVNAMALKLPDPGQPVTIENLEIIDPFNGKKDLRTKTIRAVGEPQKRFSEDALRLLRAIRFAVSLEVHSLENLLKKFSPNHEFPINTGKYLWKIEAKTLKAIKENAHLINFISKERIRDELIKILESSLAYEGFVLLHQTGLLKYIIPELEKGVGISQNRHHIYTIFQHCLLSLKYAALYNYNLNVRLAALFHDIAKPQTKKGEGPDATFYNHDILGAKFAARILSRLRFPKKTIEKVATLIRYHMFFYDPKTVTESSVRRLLRKVGPENIKELIQLRICDRKGSGVPKARPYRLRHFEYMVSKVSRDPISVKMLKVNGNDVMRILNIKPGPKVGLVLNALLWEVLEEPERNKKEYLEKRIKELGQMPDESLREIGKKVEEKKMEIELEEKRSFRV